MEDSTSLKKDYETLISKLKEKNKDLEEHGKKTEETDKIKSIKVLDELIIGHGNPNKNKNLITALKLYDIYDFMNLTTVFLSKIQPDSDYNYILQLGHDELIQDSTITEYINQLNYILSTPSLSNNKRFSSWYSHDEDFHFIYECKESFKITYSKDLDKMIGDLSHNLKMRKDKIVSILLLYGARKILKNFNQEKDNEIYNLIVSEIDNFRLEYSIKTWCLKMRTKDGSCVAPPSTDEPLQTTLDDIITNTSTNSDIIK